MSAIGTHRCVFKLDALDIVLALGERANKEALEKGIQGHTVDKAELIGLYGKSSKKRSHFKR